MLHEHGAVERNQDGNLRSRSSLIKCAKDTGHYRMVAVDVDEGYGVTLKALRPVCAKTP